MPLLTILGHLMIPRAESMGTTSEMKVRSLAHARLPYMLTALSLTEYVDDENTKSSPNMLKSPTSELWDDGPDELLFYEAEEGDANEVERARSEEGENSQEPREHPEEYDEHTEHDEFAISYEDDVIDPVPETIPVLTSRTELPPVETKPSSPIRSWSTHSSKRSFNDDGSENGADYLGRKGMLSLPHSRLPALHPIPQQPKQSELRSNNSTRCPIQPRPAFSPSISLPAVFSPLASLRKRRLPTACQLAAQVAAILLTNSSDCETLTFHRFT